VTSGDGQELARCPMTGITFSPTERTLWLKNSDAEDSRRQRHAAVDALIGIKPADELEGMIASQLLAAQNAAMECYRRAMIGDQTFEGRRENLSQANKLSRTYAVLLDTLNRHRGKGQQKVTVEHVHVHAGGQAVVGSVATAGGGDRAKSEDQAHAKQIGSCTSWLAERSSPLSNCRSSIGYASRCGGAASTEV
jgi:hypothetical protein